MLLGLIYLAYELPYSLLTRAWEPNDELDHTMYVEHIIARGSFPRIGLVNGIESHQPPLYYLLAAAWQELLRIPAFVPSASPIPGAPPRTAPGPFLAFSHQYTIVQHQNAVYLHELRLLSVLFGLATVLLSYGCARLVLCRSLPAFSVGLVVALWPKELVVGSAVTNDALVITLSALALYLFLLSEGARATGEWWRRRCLVLAMGTALGLAAITKFNSLPLAALLLLLTALPVLRRPAMVLDSILAGSGFLAVSLWWFIRNKMLYGQFLASRATETYLKAFGYRLIVPVPWNSTSRFGRFVPSHLYHSVWYDGAGNQWLLPNWMNNVLWVAAALSVMAAIGAVLGKQRQKALAPSAGWLSILGIAGSVLAGITAVLVIAKTTRQAEGRIAFVGLVGFALVLVLGTDLSAVRRRASKLAIFIWPLLLFGANAYVLAAYVIPFRGL